MDCEYLLSEEDCELIKNFAECDLHTVRVARKMHYTHGSISYRTRRIKEKTGLDPRSFYDMIKLLEIVDKITEV